MLFLPSLPVRVLACLLVLPGADGGTKDLILRHQLPVLRRKTSRSRFITLDRVLLTAASRVLASDRWASFLVMPQTLLRCTACSCDPNGPTGRNAGPPGGYR
jgi:hypothetical protein